MTIQQTDKKGFLAGVSMASKGSRLQFGVAVVLITILPILMLVYLSQGGDAVRNLPEVALWSIGAILIGIVCLGYGLLIKYPMTIINLRRYMESIARGELPDAIGLPEGESDITAIRDYFNLIIAQMKKRITVIQEQQKELIKAERQRVMTESLCTACHHLGQHATTISCYLDLLKSESLSFAENGHLACCIDEADRLRGTLKELQNITEYQTEPYCVISGKQEESSLNIIRVSGDKALCLPRG